jgi:hypothetical protein
MNPWLTTSAAYLDPSFEAMIRCQLQFAQEGYEKLSGVQRWVMRFRTLRRDPMCPLL